MSFKQHGREESWDAFEADQVKHVMRKIGHVITLQCEAMQSSGAGGLPVRKIKQSLQRAYQTPERALRLVRKGGFDALKQEIRQVCATAQREVEDVHDTTR